MDETNRAEAIINRFGGISAMARALEHQNPTTVQGWKDRGFIPVKHHEQVCEAARLRGIRIDLYELTGLSPERAETLRQGVG